MPETDQPSLRGERPDLLADCSRCFGLCCVALPFNASSDFAVTKAAGTPCHHLREDFGCGIHADLRREGFAGCTVFDCFGAGQKVSQHTFGGKDWRRAPHTAGQMYAVLPVMRQLHELLWYLTETLMIPQVEDLHGELRALRDRTDRLTMGTSAELRSVDVGAHRAEVNTLLLQVSERVRARVPGRRKNRRGADLIGADLRGADLRGANLRGALLIAADLTDADLRAADLIGVDFRDARLGGADLTGVSSSPRHSSIPPRATRPPGYLRH